MAKVIYVIEDSEDIIGFFKDLFEADKYGLFEVIYFRSHAEAIRFINHASEADLAIWDINCLDLNLFDVFKRNLFRYRGASLIMSGYFNFTLEVLNAAFCGEIAYLNKPLEHDATLDIIMRVLYPGESYHVVEDRLILHSWKTLDETSQVLHLNSKKKA